MNKILMVTIFIFQSFLTGQAQFVTITLTNGMPYKDVIIDEINLVIPNVFTPNGDGNNDNFTIKITGANLIKELKVEIFNRWGMLVQSSRFDVKSLASAVVSSPSGLGAVIWNGRTTAASLAPEGTYFYVITYTTTNDEVKSEKGSVTLLR